MEENVAFLYADVTRLVNQLSFICPLAYLLNNRRLNKNVKKVIQPKKCLFPIVLMFGEVKNRFTIKPIFS